MIVLDTHVLIWWINGDPDLGVKARRLIHKARKEGKIYISSMTTWEIAMLLKSGRLVLAMPLNEWIEKIEKLPFVSFVPVDNGIARDAVNLPGDFHKDPADRMIVATARSLNVTLVTCDKKILGYGHVKTAW
jgi:PIN domain nuclease of toxin-antitoxin system